MNKVMNEVSIHDVQRGLFFRGVMLMENRKMHT